MRYPCRIFVVSVWYPWSREVGFEGELRLCWLQRYQTFWRSAPELGNICQQMYSLLILFRTLVFPPTLDSSFGSFSPTVSPIRINRSHFFCIIKWRRSRRKAAQSQTLSKPAHQQPLLQQKCWTIFIPHGPIGY